MPSLALQQPSVAPQLPSAAAPLPLSKCLFFFGCLLTMCSPGNMPQSSETSGTVRNSHCDHRAEHNDTQIVPSLAHLSGKLATRPTSTTTFPRFQRVADGAVPLFSVPELPPPSVSSRTQRKRRTMISLTMTMTKTATWRSGTVSVLCLLGSRGSLYRSGSGFGQACP